LDCPSGRYQPDTASAACLPCVPGKFKSDAGRTECVDCAANTFSKLAGSSSCAICPTQRTAKKGSVQCQVCGKGKKKVTNVADSELYTCVDCNAGYWSDSDSLECTACPKGFHTAATNSESCKVCKAGRFGEIEANSKEAEAACSKCIAGRYSSAKGVTKADDCIGCAPGKWSDTVGATLGSDCKDCTIDYFSADEGRTTNCDKCTADATTLEAGLTICLKCNAGLHLETTIADGSKSCRTWYVDMLIFRPLFFFVFVSIHVDHTCV
jgi:proprotein convertase subtilisin/kexin type 5